MYEDEAWINCHDEDLWLFDKLIIAKRLHYVCGPIGVDVPKSDYYIVRPSMNCMGMSRGATIEYIQEDTDNLPLGYFWCEIFNGRHLSVDYKIDNVNRSITQDLTVEGFRDKGEPLWKYNRWKRVNDIVPFHEMLLGIKGNYDYINCEYIGGRLIEVHLRENSDMGDSDEIIPVWSSESDPVIDEIINPPKGYSFEENEDYHRLGFYKKIGEI